MIQHYSSRHVYNSISLATDTPDAITILSSGKSYIFYGAVFSGSSADVWFTDQDGNFLWAVHHEAQNPTPFTDLRFVGTNGLIANFINPVAQQTVHLTVYLSDTGEGVPS